MARDFSLRHALVEGGCSPLVHFAQQVNIPKFKPLTLTRPFLGRPHQKSIDKDLLQRDKNESTYRIQGLWTVGTDTA